MRHIIIQFVSFDDLFFALEDLASAFFDTNPNHSWGDNRITLVTAGDILDHLKDQDCDAEQFSTLCERISELVDREATYVNLET